MGEQNQAFYSESSITIWSWGEDILVRFQENKQGALVIFSSSCKLSTQFIDWGKNKINAQNFLRPYKLANTFYYKFLPIKDK